MVVKTQEEKLLLVQTDFLAQPLQMLFFAQGVKRIGPYCCFHLGVTVQGTLEDILVPSNVQAFGLERHPQSLPPLLEIVFQRGLLGQSHERGHCLPFSHSVVGDSRPPYKEKKYVLHNQTTRETKQVLE